MANIYGRSTATFKPYSFEEMLRPALMATEAHNKLEEEYSTLETLTADLEVKLSKNPKDEQLRATYNAYKDALNQASEELYSKGLTASSKRIFNRLKTEYGEKINPIQEAYKKYIEQQDFINKLAVTNPEVIVTGAGDSVSDYIGTNIPKLTSVNLDKLTAQALAEAKADSARTYRESNWAPTAGGRYQERFTSTGLTDEQFDAAIKNLDDYRNKRTNVLSEDAAAMQNIINNVIGGSNYNALSNTQKLKALDAIKAGLRSGYAYDKKIQTQVDPMFAYNLKVKEEQAKRTAKQRALLEQIGTDAFITSKEGKAEFMSNYLKTDGSLKAEYQQYFKNGKLKTPDEIKQEITNRYKQEIEAYKNKDVYKYGLENIGQLSNESYIYPNNNGDYKNVNDVVLEKRVNKALEDYNTFVNDLSLIGLDSSNTSIKSIDAQIGQTKDAYVVDRFNLVPDSNAQNVIQQRIESAVNNGEQVMRVKGMITDEKGNKHYKTESIDFEDLLTGSKNDKKLNILSVNLGLGQGTAKIKTDDGIVEIQLPDAVYHNSGASYGMSDADLIRVMEEHLTHARNNEVFNPETKKYEKVDPRDIIELPDGTEGTIADLELYLILKQYEKLSGVLGKNVSFKLNGED